jgi:hypothetical protein
VIEFVVPGLDNETPYYFAVTAYDTSANESENYSEEVSGTPEESFGEAPSHGASDEEPPIVSEATATDQETVRITFSEAVVIPPLTPESAFSIVNNATSEALVVSAVEMDPDDLTGSSVLLTTDPQEAGEEYILTVGIQVEDAAGNPIISGTSDTAAFVGSNVAPGEDIDEGLPGVDEIPPQVVSASSLSENEVQVIFSESIILNSDPTANFSITVTGDPADVLDIAAAEKDSTGSVVTLTTSTQKDESYTVVVTDVIDESANFIDETANTADFVGGSLEPAPDEEAPPSEDPPAEDLPDETVEDSLINTAEIKNLLIELVRDFVVKLTWSKSNADIMDQILYKSLDGGSTYDSGTSLGPDREEVEVTGLSAGKEYYFKVTTKDNTGVESDGIIKSFRLPETGMGLGLLFASSAGLAYVNSRRKRKNLRK